MLFKKRSYKCTAIIAAAGSGTRFGGDKLFCLAGGMPVLAHTLIAFQNASCIHSIIIVTRHDRICDVQDICNTYKITKTCEILAGGKTRAESVLRGVMAAKHTRLCAIHDGARPLVSTQLIERVVERAQRSLAALPAIEVSDTVKVVENGVVTSTPQRSTLRKAQTPQVFETNLIRGALFDAIRKNLEITDDSEAVETLGVRVSVVEGDTLNFKITTSADLAAFSAILDGRTT